MLRTVFGKIFIIWHFIGFSDIFNSRVTAKFQCGDTISFASNGFIQSPNFPAAFPVPIRCRWLLQAPPGKRVVLYFTQFYLRFGFRVSEYDSYEVENGKTFHRGKRDLGTINFENKITSLMALKPFVLIQFELEEITGNTHLRVEEYMNDVYGFNITYETSNENDKMRSDACSVYKCSYLGNCHAAKGFKNYYCDCFPGFYGDSCQYGPACSPHTGLNRCENGGSCRYFLGSLYNKCDCPPGFNGPQCEIKDEEHLPKACKKLRCSQSCKRDDGTSKNYSCSCFENFQLDSDNKTCIERGRLRYMVWFTTSSARIRRLAIRNDTTLRMFVRSLERQMQIALATELNNIEDPAVINTKIVKEGTRFEFHFIGEKIDVKKFEAFVKRMVDVGKVPGGRRIPVTRNYTIKYDQALNLLSLENYDKTSISEGNLLTLVCVSRGSSKIKFHWYKDGAPVNVVMSTRNIWETRLPKTMDDKYIAILNIDKVTPLDRGRYSCIATDYKQKESKQIHVDVIPIPHIEVAPITVTAMAGQSVAISCISHDDTSGNFEFIWEREGKHIMINPVNDEVVEKLLPTGSRLKIRRATVSTYYNCRIKNGAGESSAVAYIDVVNENTSFSHFSFKIKEYEEKLCCPSDTVGGRGWAKTAPGKLAIIECPKGATGRVTRKCLCVNNSTSCSWDKPDMSNCVSNSLSTVEREFRAVTHGYILSAMDNIVAQLNDFTSLDVVYTGDLKLVTRLLLDIDLYTSQYLSHRQSSKMRKASVKVVSQVLSFVGTVTETERKKSEIGDNILKLISRIGKRMIDDSTLQVPYEIKSLNVDMLLSSNSRVDDWNSKIQSNVRGARSVNSDVKSSSAGERIVNVRYKNLQYLLPDSSVKLNYSKVNSDIYSVVGNNPHNKNQQFRIRLQHNQPTYRNDALTCARRHLGMTLIGNWVVGDCKLVEDNTFNYSTCECSRPGHYVLLFSEPKPMVLIPEIEFEASHSYLACCLISTSLLIALLFAHVLFARNHNAYSHIFPISILILLILVDLSLLCVSFLYRNALVRVSLLILVYYCYLLCYSIALFEMIRLYLTVAKHVRTNAFVWKIFYTLALGVPCFWLLIQVVASHFSHDPGKLRSVIMITAASGIIYIFLFALLTIVEFVFLVLFVKSLVISDKSVSKHKIHIAAGCRAIIVNLHIVFMTTYTYQTFTYLLVSFYQHLLSASLLVSVIFGFVSYGAQEEKILEGIYEVWKRCRTKVSEESSQAFLGEKQDSSFKFTAFVRPQLTVTEIESNTGTSSSWDPDIEYCIARHQCRLSRQKRERLKKLVGGNYSNSSKDSEEYIQYPDKLFYISGGMFLFDKVKCYIVDDRDDSISATTSLMSYTSGKVSSTSADIMADETSRETTVQDPFPEIQNGR
ncbi:uncharacterized protein LOC141899088 [Tubulanus polymorphus]|uniref:uncharacterized protein LOC141899088 n=1 Tax=Tubulanus polymorphus TaxID=672921 RepID=UPI003DA21EA9